MLYKGRVQYCIHLTEKKDRSQEILEVLETGPKGFNEIHLKLSGNHTSLRANLTRLMDRGQIILNASNKKYEKMTLLVKVEILSQHSPPPMNIVTELGIPTNHGRYLNHKG